MSKTVPTTEEPTHQGEPMTQGQPEKSRQEQSRDMFTIDPAILAGGPMPRPAGQDNQPT